MADKTIDSENIMLTFGNWGPVTLPGYIPTDGFDGVETGNATQLHPLGSVSLVFNDGDAAGVDGPAEFAYLQVGTQNADELMAVKMICSNDTAGSPYVVSNDPDTVLQKAGGRCAIGLKAMTDGDFGWFQTGGVIAESFVSGLGGTYLTDSTVDIGPMSISDLDADFLGFSLTAADTEMVCGIADAADAT